MYAFFLLLACVASKEQTFDYVFQTESNEESPSESENANDQSSEDDSAAVSESENENDSEESAPESMPDDSIDPGVCTLDNVGTSTGDCAEDFSLSDIDDALVSLHDFHGQVIFLDLSSYN